jgi:hypothetical protein
MDLHDAIWFAVSCASSPPLDEAFAGVGQDPPSRRHAAVISLVPFVSDNRPS